MSRGCYEENSGVEFIGVRRDAVDSGGGGGVADRDRAG